MKSKIEYLRGLIIKDEIPQALDSALNQLPSEHFDEIRGYQGRLSRWLQAQEQGAKPPEEEYNSIRYAFLSLLSKYEKEIGKVLNAQYSKARAAMEVDLALGYNKLLQLKQYDIVDLFMVWFMKEQPEAHASCLNQEQEVGRIEGFNSLLSEELVQQFVQSYRLNLAPSDVRYFLLKKQNKFADFFTGWLVYHNHRDKYITDLKHKISTEEKKYTRFIKSLAIGAIGAIIGSQFGTSPIAHLINGKEDDLGGGEVVVDPLMEEDPDFDFD